MNISRRLPKLERNELLARSRPLIERLTSALDEARVSTAVRTRDAHARYGVRSKGVSIYEETAMSG